MSLSPELIELIKALSGAGAGVTINVHNHAAGSTAVFKTGCIEFSGGFTPAQSATTGTTPNPGAPAKAERFTPPTLGTLKAAPTAPAPTPATVAAEVAVETAELEPTPEPAPEGEVVISYDDDIAPESEPTPQPAAVEPASPPVVAESAPVVAVAEPAVEPVVQTDPAPAPPSTAAPRPGPRTLADQLKAMRPRTED